jgi:hypothetical protein
MFISPQVIYADLARVYKNMTFNYSDIVEWCMQVETEYVCDVDVMWRYRYVARVKSGKIVLPNNVYRILSMKTVYGNDIKYPAVTSIYIHGLKKHDGKIMVIEFLGVPIDENCLPLIAASHRMACQDFCIINMLRPEYITDLHKSRLLFAMEESFSGKITAIKQGFREWTEADIQRLALHSYNRTFKNVYAKWYNYNVLGDTGVRIFDYDPKPADHIVDGSMASCKEEPCECVREVLDEVMVHVKI